MPAEVLKVIGEMVSGLVKDLATNEKTFFLVMRYHDRKIIGSQGEMPASVI